MTLWTVARAATVEKSIKLGSLYGALVRELCRRNNLCLWTIRSQRLLLDLFLAYSQRITRTSSTRELSVDAKLGSWWHRRLSLPYRR
jgi:hypothetical protein